MHFDLDTDVLVLGSGACGLTAAVAAADAGVRVTLLERSDLIGGTSAVSGGIVWVPNNHLEPAAGIADSRAQALAYLESLSLGVMDMELATAFVDRAPEMIRFLEARTQLRFHIAQNYPDYHPERPGGMPGGGRSLDPDMFSFDTLGEWARRIRQPGTDLHPQEKIQRTTLSEGLERSVPSADVLAARARRDERGRGQALVGALLRACLDRGVDVRTGVRARELVREGRAVVGARAEQGGRELLVRARAIVLATGGFEWNAELVRAFLRGPLLGPASPPENEGDAVVMALEVGAQLANMSEAWWMPTIPIPGDGVGGGKPLFRLCLAERTLPGSLIVNRRGQRFVNEAANYNDIGRAFHTFDPTHFSFLNAEAWLVFDDAYYGKYPLAGFAPRAPKPAGFLYSGASLGDLARAIGVDSDAFASTVARFNDFAAKGEDLDFQRGRSVYDSYNGDRSLPRPFTTLGPLVEPPFHAIKLVAGALGTKGGAKTNTSAQVLDPRGRVIPGLYAAGNAMAGATGLVYGGAGGTLGPGMTYGYIAGQDAAKSLTPASA
jgi:succinate dehydrogenase/fumarate reductase flavoprotein subunit